MSSFVFTEALRGLFLDHTIDWATDDIRALLIKSASPSTADAGDLTVADYLAGAPDELTDASYARVALTGRSVSDGSAAGLAGGIPFYNIALQVDLTRFPLLAGAETVTGIIVYKHVTNDSDSIPLVAGDFVDIASNGDDFVVLWRSGAGNTEAVTINDRSELTASGVHFAHGIFHMYDDATFDWVNDDIRMLLLKDADPDATMVAAAATVTELLSTDVNELTDASYARVALTNKTDAMGTNLINYDSDPVTFPLLAGAETVTAAVIYKHVTNDSDSIPLMLHNFTNTATDGTDFVVNPDATAWFQIKGAP